MDERRWSTDDVRRGDVRDGGHQMVMATVCHRRAVFNISNARGGDETVHSVDTNLLSASKRTLARWYFSLLYGSVLFVAMAAPRQDDCRIIFWPECYCFSKTLQWPTSSIEFRSNCTSEQTCLKWTLPIWWRLQCHSTSSASSLKPPTNRKEQICVVIQSVWWGFCTPRQASTHSTGRQECSSCEEHKCSLSGNRNIYHGCLYTYTRALENLLAPSGTLYIAHALVLVKPAPPHRHTDTHTDTHTWSSWSNKKTMPSQRVWLKWGQAFANSPNTTTGKLCICCFVDN